MNSHVEKVIKTFPDIFEKANVTPEMSREEFVNSNPELTNLTDQIYRLGGLEVPYAAWMATAVNMFYHLSRYMVCGAKDFMVMPYLSGMLTETSINVDERLLVSPFPALCIEPPPTYGRVYNEETGEHNMRCIYMTFDNHPEGKEIRIMTVGKANKMSTHELDDAFFYFNVFVLPDKTVEESLHISMAKMRHDLTDQYDEHHAKILIENINRSEAVFSYCLNVLLYVNSTNADKKWRDAYPHSMEQKLAKLNDENRIKKLKKMNTSYYKCVLGSNVINMAPSKSVARRWKHQNRTFVRGHYHGYWYGPKDSQELKPKWLEPYWKGPEAADVVHTKFQVGDE